MNGIILSLNIIRESTIMKSTKKLVYVDCETLYSQTPTINSGISILNNTVNPVILESMAPSAGASVNRCR